MTVLLDSPELHLGADILVPDLAGWRRERAEVGALEGTFATLPPDFCGEVLSPSRARLDRGDALQTLEVLRLDGPTYRLAATFAGDRKVRAEPFDAIEIDLRALWE